MKHRFLKAICALCLVPAFLTGCWHEDTEEPDSGQLLISQELAEPVQEEVILPAALSASVPICVSGSISFPDADTAPLPSAGINPL